MNLIICILGIGLTLLSIWNAIRGRTHRLAWSIFALLLLSGFLFLSIGEAGATIDENGIVHECLCGIMPMLLLGGITFLFGVAGAGVLVILSIFRFISAR